MAVGHYTEVEYIAGSINNGMAFVSLVATLITLWLIFELKQWNGCIVLILNLTICQLLYDLNFFFIAFYDVPAAFAFNIFLSTFGGLSVALWTNVIALVVFNIVQYLQAFNIRQYLWYVIAAVVLPSLLMAVLEVIFIAENNEREYDLALTYYWTRNGSIAFNIIIHGLISWKLHRMGWDVGSYSANDPVHVLASRLKYYPIVQVLTRVGAAWYEFSYGFVDSQYSAPQTPTRQAALYLFAMCSPAAGLGYFIVFLIFQPFAYKRFRKLVLGSTVGRLVAQSMWFCCSCGGSIDVDDDMSSTYGSEDGRGSASRSFTSNSFGRESALSRISDPISSPMYHPSFRGAIEDRTISSAGTKSSSGNKNSGIISSGGSRINERVLSGSRGRGARIEAEIFRRNLSAARNDSDEPSDIFGPLMANRYIDMNEDDLMRAIVSQSGARGDDGVDRASEADNRL